MDFKGLKEIMGKNLPLLHTVGSVIENTWYTEEEELAIDKLDLKDTHCDCCFDDLNLMDMNILRLNMDATKIIHSGVVQMCYEIKFVCNDCYLIFKKEMLSTGISPERFTSVKEEKEALMTLKEPDCE